MSSPSAANGNWSGRTRRKTQFGSKASTAPSRVVLCCRITSMPRPFMQKLRTACCAFTYPKPRLRSQSRWRSRSIELGTACIERAGVDPRFHPANVDADGDGVLDRERVALELLTRLEYFSLYCHVGESPCAGIPACGCRCGCGPQQCDQYSLEGGRTFKACLAPSKSVYDAAGRNDLILQYVHLILFCPGDGDGPAFSGGSRDRRRLVRCAPL